MARYAPRLAQCQREAAAGNIVQALKLFDECSPSQRGWEHGHLWLQIAEQARRVAEGRSSRNTPHSICFSRDGRLLAAGSRVKQIHIWEASTGRLLRVLQGRQQHVWSVDLSPDGRWLASAAGQRNIDGKGTNEVLLWNAKNKELHRELKGHQGDFFRVRVAPDGSWLASHGLDGKIHLWEVPSGKRLRTFDAPGKVESLAVHPEGKLLAYGSKKQVFLRHAQTGKVIHTLTGFSGTINSAAFSGDGKLLASDDLSAGSVCVWDVATGKKLRSFGDGEGQAACVAFAPGKRPLLAFGLTNGDGYTVVDLAGNKTIRSISTDYFTDEGVCFSPDGSRLAFPGKTGVGIVLLNSSREPKWLPFEPEWLSRFNASDKMTPPRIFPPESQVKVQLEKQAGRQPGARSSTRSAVRIDDCLVPCRPGCFSTEGNAFS